MRDTLKAPLRWMLHSPRRLLAVVISALVLVAVVQCSKSTPTATVPEPTGSTSTTTPAPTTPPPLMGDTTQIGSDYIRDTDPVAGTEQLVELTAAQTALAYLDAWGHPELSQEQWLAGVAPYVTGRCFETLKTVDPANTQPLQITGPHLERAYFDGDSAAFDIPTNVGTITVYLINAENGAWLVDIVDLVR